MLFFLDCLTGLHYSNKLLQISRSYNTTLIYSTLTRFLIINSLTVVSHKCL